jgi:hypothetical protein
MSITWWTRLEPRARKADMKRALQVCVRDPLWMLARQRQVGELNGEDAGSPVVAQIQYTTRMLTGYRPIGGPAVPFDDAVPMEAHVEREGVSLGLRASVQLGLFLEGRLPTGAVVQDFRAAFPIDTKTPAAEIEDPRAIRLRQLAAGRVTDGEEAYRSFIGAPGAPPLPASASSPAAQAALGRLKDLRETMFTTPDHDSAWDRPNLDYNFAVGSDMTGDAVGKGVELTAEHFRGGSLDWYSFNGASASIGGNQPGTETTTILSFVPTKTSFGGMAGSRWWDFEDAQLDFGSLLAEHTDLAKLLVMEFAILYGGDWFQLPIQLDLGSICNIKWLVVTDTFGQMTQIPAAADVPAVGRPWSMFRLSGDDDHKGMLFMAPALARWQDAVPLEEVVFLRDDLAAIGWAVEKTLQSPVDLPVDGQEAFLKRLKDQPPPPPPAPPAPAPDAPTAWYLLGTTVPDNYIPLVPVRDGSLQLRRGMMARAVGQAGQIQNIAIPARGQILEPSVSPYFIHDRCVPAAGAQVARYIRRTRWLNGKTFVWIARRSQPGKGPGWSGLQFDLIQPMGQGPDLVHP